MTGGELLRESWAQLLSLPAAENPFNGHCQPLADGKVPTPIAFGLDPSSPITCTARAGTTMFIRIGAVCTSVDKPAHVDEAGQIQCARAIADRYIKALSVTVDGGETVNIREPRFEITSPQGTVALPAIAGDPPQTATFSAFAWAVFVSKLDRGQHTTKLHVVGPGLDVTYTTNIEIV
jgi:hypothetical protein